jgi:23S rRNA pseudouridine2605 synthase
MRPAPKTAQSAQSTKFTGPAETLRSGRKKTPAIGDINARPEAAPETQKLQKLLAQAGLGSRREMEELITAGQATINGKIAHIGDRVGPEDVVRVGKRVIHSRSGKRTPRVMLYHKPEGEIASRDDPRGRPSVFEGLPPVPGGKWISIGRLDFNTCGLLLFTTSGELANRMMHPRFEIEREYAVRVMGKLQSHHVQQLLDGIELDDGIARCESVELRGGENANQWCHIVLREGRNRVVRRLFDG